jgi:hypothetical protein
MRCSKARPSAIAAYKLGHFELTLYLTISISPEVMERLQGVRIGFDVNTHQEGFDASGLKDGFLLQPLEPGHAAQDTSGLR